MLLQDPVNKYVMVDSTIVRAHQLAVCGKGGAKVRLWAAPAADCSTKVHLLVDAQGRPVRFSLTGGQWADVSQAIPLLTAIETGAAIAAKGYESNRVLAFIRDQGACSGHTDQVKP